MAEPLTHTPIEPVAESLTHTPMSENPSKCTSPPAGFRNKAMLPPAVMTTDRTLFVFEGGWAETAKRVEGMIFEML